MTEKFTTVNLLDLLSEILQDYFVIDDESCIVTISDSLAAKLGYNPEELIGYSYTCVAPPSTRHWFESATKKPGAQARKSTANLSFLRADKSELLLSISLVPIAGENTTLYLVVDETGKRQLP